ncbi:MAG: hypothetical protein M5R40_05400 [Anaerolineae bacterium]|nr:hypothetical protein [Anaerolineae bacterium]
MATTRSAQTVEALRARVRPTHNARKPWGSIVMFIGPTMLLYALFLMIPVLTTFYNSLHHIEPTGGQLITTYVGLENYIDALTSDRWFGMAVKNTVIWALAGPVIEMFTATALALILYFQSAVSPDVPRRVVHADSDLRRGRRVALPLGVQPGLGSADDHS